MENNKLIKGLEFNKYHINYYHEKIKGNKKTCDECGLIFDVYRKARHFSSKKHAKNKLHLDDFKKTIDDLKKEEIL